SFKNKALRRLFEDEDKSGIPPDQVNRIENRLTTLDAAKAAEDMTIAGYGFHQLTGDLKGFYAVRITRNWRIIFRFENGDAFDVDHIDYH
ncbi:MAG: type II toxin-antitoxin system RelE/ParE family toxin, partial [Acidimicrobiales bacterium]